MKKLFLHIGAGKTGSSALQVWLSQNKLKLNPLNKHEILPISHHSVK